MTRPSAFPPTASPRTGAGATGVMVLVFGLFMAVTSALAATSAGAQAVETGEAIWAGDLGAGIEPALSPGAVPTETESADMVLVYKSRRTLYLMRDGAVLRSYQVALGRNPFGHKNREGDGRTPEGGYLIDWRNPNSDFHLSLHISYPRPQDYRLASEAGFDPGGAIMIHGLPNGRSAEEIGHPRYDWTNGCIAVSNEEIEEIWHLVEDGTAIFILP